MAVLWESVWLTKCSCEIPLEIFIVFIVFFLVDTCVHEGINCNCDSNDYVWRYDDGYLTDKEMLPVTKLHFGDTGAEPSEAMPSMFEKGFYTLGPLECF